MNAEAENPDLWNNPENAQKVMRERNRVDKQIADFKRITQAFADGVELHELAESEGDEATRT